MISIIFGSSSLFSLATMNRLNDGLESYALARASVPYVLEALNNKDKTESFDGLSDTWRLGGEMLFREQPLGDGVFSVSFASAGSHSTSQVTQFGVRDEESRLNLNTATTDTLKNLFALITELKITEMEALADCIADWRDADSDKSPDGAEESEYLSKRPSYEPKNGDFESVEELLLVKGMTPALFSKVSPFVTVYGSGKVNINTASKYVLMALGLSENGADAVLFYRLGNDGIEGTEDDAAAQNVNAIAGEIGKYLSFEDLNILGGLIAQDALTVQSEAFAFTAEGKSEMSEYPVIIECVLKRSGEILAWQEN